MIDGNKIVDSGLDWTQSEPTADLRWLDISGPGVVGMKLQQRWAITRRRSGGMYYEQEWRDIPIVKPLTGTKGE